jgi:hypothetical protein
MGADLSGRLEMSAKVVKNALEAALSTWKSEETVLDVGVRKIQLVKKTFTVSLFLSVREGEEGFELHVDWPSGFCRDSFRGFSSINAEKAIKGAIARATVLEELSLM